MLFAKEDSNGLVKRLLKFNVHIWMLCIFYVNFWSSIEMENRSDIFYINQTASSTSV